MIDLVRGEQIISKKWRNVMKTEEQEFSTHKKWKKRSQFLFKTFGLFILFGIPVMSQAQGLVDVLGNPSVVNATIGDDFTIIIQLDATGANVTVADIYMTFNPNVVHVTSTSFAPGSPFTSSTFPAPAPDNVLGKWSRGGFGFAPATTLVDYIAVNCTAVGQGTTTMDYVSGTTPGTLLAYAGQDVTGTLSPIQINVIKVTVDCPDLGVNNGDPCPLNGQLGEYLNCECVAYDCNWVAGGTASIDDCGVCSGGNTGIIPNETCTDCEGVVNGNSHPGSICYNGTDVGTYNADCECISNQPGNIDGTVSGLAICGLRNITISTYNAEHTELNAVFSTTIDANGDFATPSFSTGTYSVLIKVDGYLAKLYPNKIIESGSNQLAISGLIAGDVNNTNNINILDVTLFSMAFGSTVGDSNYNLSVDLNCDGIVNILDFTILSPSFGLEGDHSPDE